MFIIIIRSNLEIELDFDCLIMSDEKFEIYEMILIKLINLNILFIIIIHL